MKIQLAEHYGLCFGVRDAIAQAEKLATAGPLTILGELVHNPVVRERLDSLGVREGRLDAPGDAPTPQVMITAHGASDAARAAWRGERPRHGSESDAAADAGPVPLKRCMNSSDRRAVSTASWLRPPFHPTGCIFSALATTPC